MFDLPKQREALTDLIVDGLLRFEAVNPEVVWSNIAFDSCPWMGWVAINFDTKEKSDQIVAEYQHKGPAWYEEDKRGKFNNNCADFEYCAFLTHEIPEWHEAYESIGEDYLVNCIDANGQSVLINLELEGDEGLNKIVFVLLKEILLNSVEKIKSLSKNKGIASRVGVQMCSSECEYFELL